MPSPSPKPPTRRTPVPEGAGSPFRAVITGLVVDIGGSALIGLVLSMFYAAQLSSNGMSSAEIKEAMAQMPADSPIAIVGTLLGALCSVAGGYVCARIVQRDEFRVGGVMAALSGFAGLMMIGDDTPDDLVLLLTASTVACVLLGVKYGRERNQRPDADPPPAPPPQP
jgi:hypothetical protein